ncbi:hypothetical protein D0869_05652 [Hortaea werneckii]|uniref:DUF7918 domain-containing protein n=1 Tax=Hortaea werneckii TaxID=91943 RepID=A0A3M6WWH2_HORWE|nr:hypothetical protein D0869_05652 [Hortaea werneckii]RMY09048.1 hypothetical protein D0868_04456 [Hortaea werneckii]
MAIHPNVPGLTVGIDVAGQDRPEHDGDDTQDSSSNTATKYIEAVSGAEFAISYRLDTNVFAFAGHAMSISVYCDGDPAGRTLVPPNVTISGTRNSIRHHIQESINGDLIRRPMMFSDLTTSEAEVNKDLFSKLKTVGTIVVKWHTGKIVPFTRTSAPSPFSGAKVANGKVPEKNLKGQAITHQTAPYAVMAGSSGKEDYPISPFDALGSPLQPSNSGTARMVTALQSMGILPRSPSPIPLEDRNIEDLDPEEMRELLRRQQRQRESSEVAIKREIKRERSEFEDDDDDDDGDDVEIVDRPEKKPRLDVDDPGTEVVDLCGDD